MIQIMEFTKFRRLIRVRVRRARYDVTCGGARATTPKTDCCCGDMVCVDSGPGKSNHNDNNYINIQNNNQEHSNIPIIKQTTIRIITFAITPISNLEINIISDDASRRGSSDGMRISIQHMCFKTNAPQLIHHTIGNFNIQPDKLAVSRINESLSTLQQARDLRLREAENSLKSMSPPPWCSISRAILQCSHK